MKKKILKLIFNITQNIAHSFSYIRKIRHVTQYNEACHVAGHMFDKKELIRLSWRS